MVFLSESHLNKVKAGKLRRKLGMDQFSIFKSDGASEGLVLFWKAPFDIQAMDIQ